MRDLSKNQIKILKSIKQYLDNKDKSPTIRDLCKLSGLSSTSSICVNLKTLEKLGYIERDTKTRSIKSVNEQKYRL